MEDKLLSEEQVRLRVIGAPEISECECESESKSKLEQEQQYCSIPELACPPANVHRPSRKEEILRILGDPDAPEEAWLAACREADSQGLGQISRPVRKQNYQFLLTAILSLLIVFPWLCHSWLTSIGKPNMALPAPPPLAPGQAIGAAKVDYGPFLSSMERKLKIHWSPPVTGEKSIIKVTFYISRTGKISNIQIILPDRNEAKNRAAMKALKEVDGTVIPPSEAPDPVKAEFTFAQKAPKVSK